MKLRRSILRKHYRYANTTTLVPKASFNSLEEIKQKTGMNPKTLVVYDDCFCGKLHIASHTLKEKTKK